MVNLSGLKKPTGSQTVTASLVTFPPFTPNEGGAKTTCAAIVNQATTEAINTFLGYYAIKDKEGGTDESLKDKLKTFLFELKDADTAQTIRGNTGYPEINTFIQGLESTHLPVIRLVDNCLKETLQVDMTEYNAAKALKEESKSRLESIRTPEQHISYYEGWFPIIRPMTETSIFILFGAALGLLLLSITIFLSMTGVSVQIQIPELLLPQILSFLPAGTSYYLYAGLFFGIVGTYIAFRFKYI
jgi:hypothetical protein